MRPALKRFVTFSADIGLSALFALTLMLLVARSGDLEAFGTFSLALAIVGIQSPLAVFGFSTLFYSYAAARTDTLNTTFRSGLMLSMVSGLLFYTLTLGGLWLFTSFELFALYALAGLRVLGSFGELFRAIHQARPNFYTYAPLRVATLLLAIIASFATALAEADVAWYAAIWGFEWLMFSSMLLCWRRYPLSPVNPSLIWPLVTKASPLFIQSICVAIYLRFDQLYIGWRFGEADLGIYAAAARIAEAGNMVYGLIALVIAPRIIREWLAGRLSMASRAVLALIGVGSVVASGLCILWGEELLGITFGSVFKAGGLILAVYMLSTCFVVYGTIGSRLNIAQGATMPSMASGLLGAISNIILTIVLCEVKGSLGAAIATVISYILVCFIVWTSAYQDNNKRHKFYSQKLP